MEHGATVPELDQELEVDKQGIKATIQEWLKDDSILLQALKQVRKFHGQKKAFPIPQYIREQPSPFQIFKPLVSVDFEREVFGKGNIAARAAVFAMTAFVAIGVTCLSLRKTGGVAALCSLGLSLALSVPYYRWEHKRATERLVRIAREAFGMPLPLPCFMDYLDKEMRRGEVFESLFDLEKLDNQGRSISGRRKELPSS